jgi:hypothetical protein
MQSSTAICCPNLHIFNQRVPQGSQHTAVTPVTEPVTAATCLCRMVCMNFACACLAAYHTSSLASSQHLRCLLTSPIGGGAVRLAPSP